jgi:hypothetical protein
MKRLMVLMACAVLMAGCSSAKRSTMPAWQPVSASAAGADQAAPAGVPTMDAAGQPIEYIPFRAGVSTTTVENMAKQLGCTGGTGAGLTTPPGPVEEYRYVCASRKVFTARCEMRQCRPTSPAPEGGYALPPAAAAAAGQQDVTWKGGQPADPIALAEGRTGRLGVREVPSLAVVWACENCGHNDRVADLIAQSYAAAAAARGYRVSRTETAKVSITDFRQRPVAMRVMFGMMAGKDRLGVQTEFRGRTTLAGDTVLNAWMGMNSLCDTVGQQTFTQMAIAAM